MKPDAKPQDVIDWVRESKTPEQRKLRKAVAFVHIYGTRMPLRDAITKTRRSK